MVDETIQTEQAVEETAVDTLETPIEEQIDYSSQKIEIIIPEKEPVEPTEEEVIQNKIRELQYKVAIGTATTTEKSDLKLLIA